MEKNRNKRSISHELVLKKRQLGRKLTIIFHGKTDFIHGQCCSAWIVCAFLCFVASQIIIRHNLPMSRWALKSRGSERKCV